MRKFKYFPRGFQILIEEVCKLDPDAAVWLAYVAPKEKQFKKFAGGVAIVFYSWVAQEKVHMYKNCSFWSGIMNNIDYTVAQRCRREGALYD